jgi:hypothetical protein
MNTFLDMQTELISRLSSNGSSFYTAPRIKSAINVAKTRAETRHLWPMLEDAFLTSTTAGLENYDYPEQWRTDSVIRLMVDSLDGNGFQIYDKKNFEDYLDYQAGNDPAPNPKYRIYADYNRQFFITPVPTVNGPTIGANGVGNVKVWGVLASTNDLVADTDTTIFSTQDASGNEGIVKIAYGILIAKGKNKKEGQIEESEGTAMLDTIWNKIILNKQRAVRLNHPRYSVPDYFRTGSSMSTPGNFNTFLNNQQG